LKWSRERKQPGLRRLKAGIKSLILPALLFCTSLLLADGGIVQFRQQAGPFIVTLFSTHSPLRAGPADLSVLVESLQSRSPILDASVSLRLLDSKGAEITAVATHAQATNKLLYATLPVIPQPGAWAVRVNVARGDKKAIVAGTVQVLAAPPALVHYWPYFAIVPCAVVLFALNQYLKAKQRRLS
jgi:hypothetical protein